jgi:hypothetical protein
MPTPRALAEFACAGPRSVGGGWYLWRAVDLHRVGKLPAPTLKTRIKLEKKRSAPAKTSAVIRRAKKTVKRARKVARTARKERK